MKAQLLKLLHAVIAGVGVAIVQQFQAGWPVTWAILWHTVLAAVLVRVAGFLVARYGPSAYSSDTASSG